MRGPTKKIRDFCAIAIMAAILETVKLALSSVANVEGVTLLVIVFTRNFGIKRTLPAVMIFTFVEMVWWGPGIWVLSYLFVWPLLIFLVSKVHSEEGIPYIILSAGFGLFFGALCAMITMLFYGPAYAFSWWVSGIPYDLIHAVSNGLIVAILMKPLNQAASIVASGYDL